MNPYIQDLLPYPFERLAKLKENISPNSDYPHTSLALGEPKHPSPDFIVDLFRDESAVISGLGAYPATRGEDQLREVIATWHRSRYKVQLNPDLEILPVSGTREALFSFGQAVLSGCTDKYTLLPNPFYQIYEGAAFLRGSQPYYVPSTKRPEFELVPDHIWERTDLLFVCNPGNPSGYVMSEHELRWLIEHAQKYDFVLAADECYSEIYLDEDQPPMGLLEAASSLGLNDFHNCVTFNSLSKRSNCPGLRSGFVAGDPQILKYYYEYRTYHGCAMPLFSQQVSTKAWSDEQHVTENRARYREKFETTYPMVTSAFGNDVELPGGGFYYWLDVGYDDEKFAAELFSSENITVLPGSYVSRQVNNNNPGSNHVRIALVAPLDDCVPAMQRLCKFASK